MVSKENKREFVQYSGEISWRLTPHITFNCYFADKVSIAIIYIKIYKFQNTLCTLTIFSAHNKPFACFMHFIARFYWSVDIYFCHQFSNYNSNQIGLHCHFIGRNLQYKIQINCSLITVTYLSLQL